MSTPGQNVPLVVDLDGTLIRSDMMWESISRLVRRNPFAILQLLFWWTRGRALLKQKLATRVQVNPDDLALNEKFLTWLREEKKSGRKIILATASDLKMAQPIAERVSLFDEVLGSDGKTNLRSENKRRALEEKFGPRGFDYAGNSSADFAVWRGSRQAVVVNASPAVLRKAANCTEVGPTFCEDYSPFTIVKSIGTELFWRSGYLIAIVAGFMLAVAFPKFSFAGFAWICPALLMLAARGRRGADAFRAGYFGGLVFWLTSLYWLLYMPVAGLPVLAWISLSAYTAAFFGLWTWLVSRLTFPAESWGGRLRWTLSGAAIWVVLEWFRGWFLTGFPWSFLGASQYKLVPLIQISCFTGVLGVSFLVVWFSLAIYSAGEMIFRNPTKRHVWQAEIVLPMVAIVLIYVGGLFRINQAEANGAHSLRIVSIQPSVHQTLIWSPTEGEQRFRELLALSEQAMTNKPDVLLWPESAVPMFDGVYSVISRFAQKNKVFVVFNGDDAEFKPAATNYFNAAFIIRPDGICSDVYHKQRLVIFGEYVPLTRWLPFLKWLTPITDGWTPGDKSVVFATEKFSLAPLICFEDVFPGVAREAAQNSPDLLVNLTNDGWFSESSEQWQHLANAVFRAVENGIPLVRSANNGITCRVDAHGRIQQIFRDQNGSEYGAGMLMMEVPLPERSNRPVPTFYRKHGDWFALICAVMAGMALLRTAGRLRK